jgi:hypothetical protein
MNVGATKQFAGISGPGYSGSSERKTRIDEAFQWFLPNRAAYQCSGG